MKLTEIRPSRVIIDKVIPEIDRGRFAAKVYLDQEIELKVILLLDGHDQVKGRIFYRHEDSKEEKVAALKTSPSDIGNDRWRASFKPEKLGRYFIRVEAAIDRFGTWRSDILKKHAAGQNVALDLLMGMSLLNSWVEAVDGSTKNFLKAATAKLKKWAEQSGELTEGDLKSFLNQTQLESISEQVYDDASRVEYDHPVPLQVEPPLARFSSWYEFFPRSVTEGPLRHGSFKDAEKRLDYIKDLGFSVVYLPPIHPIGSAFRKGKNNSLETVPGDVGSPWAIGSKGGGHKDILAEYGDLKDFKSFLKRAKSLNLEVALDIAFQCSPDHPYVKEHPEWFKKRPDGSIQYAENPPKKYQDIYPFDFECEKWRELWVELKSIVEYWVEQGVKVFRVDNPHTKPFHFWEWLIGEVKKKNPEVIFLSEAFTRPQMMNYLAKLGFSQSYTYFTWRNTKWELTQYLTELTQSDLIYSFNPNFWPNTPDILPYSLQKPHSGMYILRVLLAGTLSSNYGLYGPAYELLEAKPYYKGGEEYQDSEKYELKVWDLNRSDSIAPVIKKLNQIRNTYSALQHNTSIRFHEVPNEHLLAFSKAADGVAILVVANLDPDRVQTGQLELPLAQWGFESTENFVMEELLTGKVQNWMGWRNYIEIRPEELPVKIFKINIKPSKGEPA